MGSVRSVTGKAKWAVEAKKAGDSSWHRLGTADTKADAEELMRKVRKTANERYKSESARYPMLVGKSIRKTAFRVVRA